MENLQELLSKEAIDIGLQIRDAIMHMNLIERSKSDKSALKKDNYSRGADALGEKICITEIRKLSSRAGYNFQIVANPEKSEAVDLGDFTESRKIFVYIDPVDGTSKIAGIKNNLEKKILRISGDGSWGVGIAFTEPTEKTLDDLTIGDFKVSVIVDGNPNLWRTYPQIVFSIPQNSEYQKTMELLDGEEIPLFTSSIKNLNQSLICYEPFQAFDRETSTKEREEFAKKLYGHLVNRHKGGAFNLVGYNCAVSGIQKLLLGWKEGDLKIESQGTAYISMNENLPNIVPAVPIICGAGGLTMDFEGNDLAKRRLKDGRTDVIYAANQSIASQILRHIKKV